MTRDGAIGRRLLDDGSELVLYPMLFGNLRLCHGDPESPFYDRGWCFHDASAALAAIWRWDGAGEPPGYYKRVGDG